MQTNGWFVEGPEEIAAVKDLDAMSDRAAAIVIATLVELRLSLAIKYRLQQDQVIIDRMFRPSGPLGSFACKIDLAFLMEVITKEAHRDLVVFKNIRNDFAHHLHALDFSAANIKKECQRFKLIETHVTEFEGADAPDKNTRTPRHYQTTLEVYDYAAHITNPRGRYVLTGRLFVAALDPNDFRKMVPPYL
jgi:DNA-binding MltR family transcriptional regulator